MQSSELIDVAINLSSDFWKDPPKAKVYIDDTLIFEGSITSPEEIKWNGELVEGNHKLIVELFDKDKYQTILENGKIVKDQLLNIDTISFDEIDIGHLKHTKSKYYTGQKENTEIITHCVNLGWNGKWELEFTTPIYMWLLENI